MMKSFSETREIRSFSICGKGEKRVSKAESYLHGLVDISGQVSVLARSSRRHNNNVNVKTRLIFSTYFRHSFVAMGAKVTGDYGTFPLFAPTLPLHHHPHPRSLSSSPSQDISVPIKKAAVLSVGHKTEISMTLTRCQVRLSNTGPLFQWRGNHALFVVRNVCSTRALGPLVRFEPSSIQLSLWRPKQKTSRQFCDTRKRKESIERRCCARPCTFTGRVRRTRGSFTPLRTRT